MPALNFDIEWPDGEVMTCYSPSTVIREYFQVGRELTIKELIDASGKSLEEAGRRIEEKFEFRCAASATQLDRISRKAAEFEAHQKARILTITEHPS